MKHLARLKNSSRSKKIYSRYWYKFVVYITIMTFYWSSLPAMAARTSGEIQNYINTAGQFERSSSVSYHMRKATFLTSTDHTEDEDISTFIQSLKQQHKPSLGEERRIPIRIGKIIIFIPQYPKAMTKIVGTPFVQSRLIRSQIVEILGRNLIERYPNEKSQIASLYANSLTFAKETGTTIGTQLQLKPSEVPQDMIWPEEHYINSQWVLVPQLYLTEATIEEYKVDDHVHRYGGNYIAVNSLSIENSTVSLKRDAFLNVADNLTNNQGRIEASTDLSILAGGSVLNLSGGIHGGGNISIGAHNIINRTLVHRYDLGSVKGERFGEIAEITSSGNVILKTTGDIHILGSVVKAGESIKFDAQGDIYIGTQKVSTNSNSSHGGISVQKSTLEHLASHLSAKDSIELMAQGNIVIEGSKIESDTGHIEILAGLGVSIENAENATHITNKGTFGPTSENEEIYRTIAMRSLLDAGKSIRIHTKMGDVVLKSVDIKSNLGTEVIADQGRVRLLLAVEQDHYSYYSKSENHFKVKTTSQGHQIESAVQNNIVGGFKISAQGGVEIEILGDSEKSLDEEIRSLSTFEGMGWIQEILDDPDVSVAWEEIDLVHKTWDKTQANISPAAAALITIAVAVATSGSGSALAASIGSTYGAMVGAAITTLSTQAAISLSNGNSLKATIEEMSKNESMKSLVISMITAGVLQELNHSPFFNAKGANDAASLPRGVQEAASLSNQAQQAFVSSTVKAGISVAIEEGSFKDFGSEFKYALMENAISLIGAHMATEIKGAFDSPSGYDQALKYISHAGLGCFLGIATAVNSNNTPTTSNACSAGAGGAVVGEMIGSLIESSDDFEKANDEIKDFLEGKADLVASLREDGFSNPEIAELLSTEYDLASYMTRIDELKSMGVNSARLGAALGAFLVGADESGVNIAAMTGQNAAENNALFLLAAIPVILSAIDLAIEAHEIYSKINEIVEAYNSGQPELGEELIKGYLGEKAVEHLIGKLIPGDKLFMTILDAANKRFKLGKKFAAVKRYIAHKRGKAGRPDRLVDNLELARNSGARTSRGVKAFADRTLPHPDGGALIGQSHDLSKYSKDKIMRNDDLRGLLRENEAAESLSNRGFSVEHFTSKNNSTHPLAGEGRFPDYKINGERWFDAYAPSSNNVDTLGETIRKKTIKQADGIVLNLKDSNLTSDSIKSWIQNNPIDNLREIIILSRDGSIEYLFPY